MAIYRGDTKVSGVGKGFRPSNTGNIGDKLEKTATGYQWVDGELVEITETEDDYSAMRGPAPSGFHVPLTTEWQGLITIMNGLNITTRDGWKTNLHLPLAGKRNCSNSNIEGQDIAGFYRSSSPGGNSYPNHSTYLNFNSGGVSYTITYRADSLPIRCFKNSYVEPTSSWTVIQGTLGSAGIFWNQTDGLISITSNGTTGYTISDKNLGATTVYSNGDTLSAANMGYMYQWGNNYGFPSTGTISNTSSTLVDASNYGPGNYYTSDTFIKGTDWSSVHNNNLRGGVTGVVPGGTTIMAGETELAGKEYVDDMLGNVETLLANI